MSYLEELGLGELAANFRSLKNRIDNSTGVETLTIDYEPLLFEQLMRVAERYPHIVMGDYDMAVVRQQILKPIAEYIEKVLSNRSKNANKKPPLANFTKVFKKEKPAPIEPAVIISGDVGIGKTILMKMIDEALTTLIENTDFTCRDVIGEGRVEGFYDKNIPVKPLPLEEGDKSSVLHISDWNNLVRLWTEEKATFKRMPEALEHFINTFRGKVVLIDDVENTGGGYLIPLLSQAGILVIASSNFDLELPTLGRDNFKKVHLHGEDHRKGDISQVCITGAHDLFDTIKNKPLSEVVLVKKFRIVKFNDKKIAFASWQDMANEPFIIRDFITFFQTEQIGGMMIDDLPFFSGMTVENIDSGTLDRIYRFVHLLDAIYNSKLACMVRLTNNEAIASDFNGKEVEKTFEAYDQKTPGKAGETAWIQLTRCLSRLRSRESINAAFFSEATPSSNPSTD